MELKMNIIRFFSMHKKIFFNTYVKSSNDGNLKKRSTNATTLCVHFLQICICTFVATLPEKLSTASVPLKRETMLAVRDDLICNLGNEHECICNRSRGNLDHSGHVPCYKFLEVRKSKYLPI